jgi:hypothetical protein
LINAGESVRWIKRFEKDRIRVLALKGAALALQVFGNLAMRHAGDIDLLIEPSNVAGADRLIRSNRYQRIRPCFELTAFQQKRITHILHDFGYFRDDIAVNLELHWHWLHAHRLSPDNFNRFWNQRQTVKIGSHTVQTFSQTDTLLYLCAHGGQHAWRRLFWIFDLIFVMNTRPPVDWSEVIEKASDLGVLRCLAQGVILSHVLFNSPLPKLIHSYALQDPTVYYLVKVALKRVFSLSQRPRSLSDAIRDLRYHLKLSENMSLKINYIYRFMFVITDWQRFPLPKVLYPLYLAIRPYSWLFRRLSNYDRYGSKEPSSNIA